MREDEKAQTVFNNDLSVEMGEPAEETEDFEGDGLVG